MFVFCPISSPVSLFFFFSFRAFGACPLQLSIYGRQQKIIINFPISTIQTTIVIFFVFHMAANMDERSLQLDQQIVLDSDRRMASYEPKPTSEPTPKDWQSQANLSKSSSQYDLAHAAHPVACIFTVFFKCASLAIYLVVSVFLPHVITFIMVAVMAALDFWAVKNVTGRLLVGLRWWSEYDSNQNQIWRYQSFDQEFKPNPVDSAFFWTGQLAGTFAWGILLFMKLLTLSLFWGILTGMNFGLCCMNLIGFYKCRGDHQSKITSLRKESLKKIAGRIFS